MQSFFFNQTTKECTRQRPPQPHAVLHESAVAPPRRHQNQQDRLLLGSGLSRPHPQLAQQYWPQQDRIPRLRPQKVLGQREPAQAAHGLGHAARHALSRLPLFREQRQNRRQPHLQHAHRRHTQGPARARALRSGALLSQGKKKKVKNKRKQITKFGSIFSSLFPSSRSASTRRGTSAPSRCTAAT